MLNSSNVVPLNEMMVFDYIDLFVDDKEQYSGSKKTSQSYASDIKLFFNFKVGGIKRYSDLVKLTNYDLHLDVSDIRRYKTYLINDINNSTATVNRKIGTIHALYTSLLNDELVTKDDMKAFSNITMPKITSNSYGILEPNEIFDIAEYLKNKKNKGRQKQLTKSNLVLFCAQTGMRLSAILNLTLNDFVENDIDVVVYGTDKGNKDNTKRISKTFYRDLLEMHKKEGEGKETVFNITIKAVNAMMKEIREHFNISDHRHITFHSIRKTAITHVFNVSGHDLNVARDFANHDNFNSIDRYLKRNDVGDIGLVTYKENVNDNLYKEVTHEQLLSVIEKLDGTTKLMINTLLSKMN